MSAASASPLPMRSMATVRIGLQHDYQTVGYELFLHALLLSVRVSLCGFASWSEAHLCGVDDLRAMGHIVEP